MSNSLDETDPTFVADLLRSQGAVEVAADWLRAHGWSVTVPETRIRPSADVRMDYSDGGDLHSDRGRVEVKHRSISFDSQESFPFETIIVDVCHTWDNADPKPCLYLIFDDDMSHCAIVHASTAPFWKKRQRYDNHCNRQRWFYECPMYLCSVERMPG